jgi:hypothetical protein
MKRLAAKSQIRDLEEARSSLHDVLGNPVHANKVKEEIIRLSLQ